VFRCSGDVAFVADALKQGFDPDTGWRHGRRYMPASVGATG
jgi:hypothetical protein